MSVCYISVSLALMPADCCMNVMLLFYIHGLIVAVLSSLAVGGLVWCVLGFDVLKFFGWMEDVQLIWYTVVPIMH